MGKEIKTLIRVREWEVDQKRRELGTSLGELNTLKKRLSQLEAELLEEQQWSTDNHHGAGVYFANYGAEVIRKRVKYNEAILELNTAIIHIREELGTAYRELKKLEIIVRKREEKMKLKEARKDQDILDDLGLDNFVRSHDFLN